MIRRFLLWYTGRSESFAAVSLASFALGVSLMAVGFGHAGGRLPTGGTCRGDARMIME